MLFAEHNHLGRVSGHEREKTGWEIDAAAVDQSYSRDSDRQSQKGSAEHDRKIFNDLACDCTSEVQANH
ncbi:hypothetical protein D3C80_1823990 [compost metagenome]